ncbi:hypothetical protein AB6A40_011089 [Gnathostoma spinigerum]|uniref:Uncharacterized protein n=1 Tax=Gnathostoma spinigerum TaxID=75299 RepID=A0ABD6EWR4_9BILA
MKDTGNFCFPYQSSAIQPNMVTQGFGAYSTMHFQPPYEARTPKEENFSMNSPTQSSSSTTTSAATTSVTVKPQLDEAHRKYEGFLQIFKDLIIAYYLFIAGY